MVHLAAVPCLLVLVLSGCSSMPVEESSTSVSTSAFTATAYSDPTLSEPLTDTLHLLEAPHVAGTLSANGEVLRSPVQSTSGSPRPAGVEYHSWELPRPEALTYVVGTARFWIEFEGSNVNAVPIDTCFWRVNLSFVRTNTTGGGNPVGATMTDDVCVAQPEALPTGIHELTISFPGRPVPADAGDKLRLWITSSSFMAPGAGVHVLSGTPEYDSTITLNGLQVPLATQTYL